MVSKFIFILETFYKNQTKKARLSLKWTLVSDIQLVYVVWCTDDGLKYKYSAIDTF